MCKKKRWIIILCAAIFLCVGGDINYEIGQKKKINQLQNDVNYLKEKVGMLENLTSFQCSDKGFNYFAIGNSITRHGIS